MAAAEVVLPTCPEEVATAEPGDRVGVGPSPESREPPALRLPTQGRGAPERGPLGQAAGWARRVRMSKGENRYGRTC